VGKSPCGRLVANIRSNSASSLHRAQGLAARTAAWQSKDFANVLPREITASPSVATEASTALRIDGGLLGMEAGHPFPAA